MSGKENIVVIGGGAWGSAIAHQSDWKPDPLDAVIRNAKEAQWPSKEPSPSLNQTQRAAI